MLGPISKNALVDRCDVIAREQRVALQKVVGLPEQVVARGVRCLVMQVRSDPVATLLGRQQVNEARGWFDASVELRAGWAIRLMSGGRVFRWTVQSVEKWPAPHDFKFQIAALAQDLVEARA